MGCCVSTNNYKRPPSSILHRQYSSRARASRAPPVVDVETVKEVLSETPNPNPFIKIQDKTLIHLLQHPHPLISDIQGSQNISTTTFDDDNDVYRRKGVIRSPVKSVSRTQVSGKLQPLRKSPVRVKEQSPGLVKVVPERNGLETGFGSVGRQRPCSGRSRSPVKRTAAGGGAASRNEIGRSLSDRKTGKSPSRVGSDLHETVRKPELRSGRQSGRFQTKDESLENPLVSLECFIFL